LDAFVRIIDEEVVNATMLVNNGTPRAGVYEERTKDGFESIEAWRAANR